MTPGKVGILMALVATTMWPQESRLSASDPSWKGIEVRFLTKMEPPGEDARAHLPGAIVIDHGRVHHMIQDTANKRHFGYDLRVEPNEDGTFVQLRIEPMQFSPGHEVSAGPGSTLLALPHYPVIPKVRVGDTVALDLLVNPFTGQKIVDYLTVRRADSPAGLSSHDFSMGDVELFLDRPQVQVNGKLVEATANFQNGITAPVVWLYLQGHGRFVLSLFPNDKLGFQKNGETMARMLTFREGSTEFRVDCTSAIAPGSGPYNLYVAHEPGWRPGGPSEPFTIGGADKAEYIVGKH